MHRLSLPTLCTAIAWLAPAATSQHAATEPPLITVVGASASEGYAWRNSEEFSPDPDPIAFAEKHLGRHIEDREYELRTDNVGIAAAIAKITDAAVRTRNLATTATMTAPERYIRAQLRAVPADTALLLSLDLMFWFGYGVTTTPDSELSPADRAVEVALHRLEEQQVGFELVEEFLRSQPNCQVVLGDYPTYPKGDRVLLPPATTPSPRVMDELNDRIRTWAAKHDRIHLYSVRDQIRRIYAGKLSVEIRGEARNVTADQFMQLDELHPNRICAAYAAVEALRFARSTLPAAIGDRLPEPPKFETALARLGTNLDDLDYLADVAARRK